MVRDLPIGAGGILSYFTRHKTVANLLLVVLVVSGLLTIPNMRAQFFPDVIVAVSYTHLTLPTKA